MSAEKSFVVKVDHADRPSNQYEANTREELDDVITTIMLEGSTVATILEQEDGLVREFSRAEIVGLFQAKTGACRIRKKTIKEQVAAASKKMRQKTIDLDRDF